MVSSSAAGIEKLKFRSMQPKPAVDGEMAAGSLMVKPAVFHSSICKAPSLPKCVVVHTGNIAIVSPSAGPTNCPKPSSLFAPRAVQVTGAQVQCKRRSCTIRKPCPECALSAHLETCGPPRSARPAASKEPPCSEIEVTVRDFESGLGVFADDDAFAFGSRRDIELGARIRYDHCVRWGMMPHTAGKTEHCNVLWAASG